MAEVSFGVKYDGPALTDGRMPVRALAPALLSLGEVFTEASLLLHPEAEPVSLEIEATSEGSFVVDLILNGGAVAWDQVSALATTDAATTLVVLKELVIGGSHDASLFGVLKWLRGKRVAEEQPAPEPGKIVLRDEEGRTLTVPSEVATLNKSVRVRKKVREVVEPLHRKGVDVLEFRSDEEVTVTVEESEVPAFDLPPSDAQELTEQEVELYLEIVAPAFKHDNKWRFSDGSKTFYALILDDDFLGRVAAREEAFRSGDRLFCRLLIIQSQAEDGSLQAERRILRVLEHVAAPRQLPLAGESSDATESESPA